ncbi:MAG: phosphatase PAP2 family protein [Xanthomonadales bacterium]|nr:phosphatase PAP2 family protein [Xanthomonadales bacterium]MCC6561615.1 phosphatase PAP2 family protein [Xanthomonadales bacterium]
MSVTDAKRLASIDALILPAPAADRSRVRAPYVILQILIASAALLWLEMDGGNRLIADHLYAWQGGQWWLKDHFITRTLIHRGGKYLSLTLWFATFASWLYVRSRADLIAWRRPLLYLLLAPLIATFLVSTLKSLTAIDCPWDMQGYGGTRPYFGLFDARPFGLRDSGCFPSGHASAGYCWLALYFFFGSVAPRWRPIGLIIGLGLGLTFGIAQQLRGAHFASHDIVTLLVCWLTAMALHIVLRPRTSTGH